jgi:hypothetical protein
MDWVNKLADQKEAADHRKQRLATGATDIFARLNTEVGNAVTVYNQRVTRPTLNEKARHDAATHTVQFGVTNAAGIFTRSLNTPSVTMTLHEPSVISAVYSDFKNRAAEIFTVELDDNGYVCLKHDEKIVAIDKATEIVLQPLLFGDAAAV